MKPRTKRKLRRLMTTTLSSLEREAGRIAAGIPHHVEAARSGNLRPALTEARKRLREAEEVRDGARYDLDGLLVDRFLGVELDAEREAESLAEVQRLEAIIADCERTIARVQPVVTHIQTRM